MTLRGVILVLAMQQVAAFSPAMMQKKSQTAATRRWVPLTVPSMGLLDSLGAEIDDGSSGYSDDDYEEALGKLVFSSSDPTMDIARDIDFYNEDFVAWLTTRADRSDDIEERSALKSLAEMVGDVREKYFATLDKVNAEVEAEDAADTGSGGGDGLQFGGDAEIVSSSPSGGGDVMAGMRAVQLGGGAQASKDSDEAREAAAKAAKAEEDRQKMRTSYIQLLATLLPLKPDALAAAVTENYLRFDFQFMQVCDEVKGSDPEQAGAVEAVMDAVNTEASKRIASATLVLQAVLQAGGPGLMETEMAKQVRLGKVDESVLNLLDANIQAAEQAGAAEPAAVLKRVQARALLELDKAKEPEQRLMSKLLKEADPEARKLLLTKAFEPVESILLDMNDSNEDPQPEVPPPTFIELCKQMIANFGNLGMGQGAEAKDLRERLLEIASEAEQVSVSIYGESMTAREQQDRMWSDGTVSVWDLETMEQQGEIVGEEMPWHGEMDEKNFLEKMTKKKGFDDKGVKKIGG